MGLSDEVNSISNDIIKKYYPLAIGIFGSGSVMISPNSDIDIYVLSDHEERKVIRSSKLIFELYFSRPELILNGIKEGNVRLVDRLRNSKVLYDPQEIYSGLINEAYKKNLRIEDWREKTIVGGDYDLIERVIEGSKKSFQKNDLESAILQTRYLVDRIIDLGLRRKNISGHANPKRIYSLVQEHLPKITSEIYKEINFINLEDSSSLINLLNKIEDNRNNLLPKIKNE